MSDRSSRGTREARRTSERALGLAYLVVTSAGWGVNWAAMKVLLREWPPLFARGVAGVAAAAILVVVAWRIGESLRLPAGIGRRLAVASFLNVFAWMGFTTLSLEWLTAGQGALLVYTMPIWAMLFAWPIRGRMPGVRDAAGLVLCVAGILTLFGGSFALGVERVPGIVFALGAAILFALGTIVVQPLPLPPFAAVAWQLVLGCAPMVALGLAFEHPRIDALSARGAALMTYMTIVPMGVCYLTWFAALRRLPGETASMATLLTPVIGVIAAAVALGEPFGARQVAALVLVIGGLAFVVGSGQKGPIGVGAKSRTRRQDGGM
jgi:drug/metabolite transporter (DMT)-like permease